MFLCLVDRIQDHWYCCWVAFYLVDRKQEHFTAVRVALNLVGRKPARHRETRKLYLLLRLKVYRKLVD